MISTIRWRVPHSKYSTGLIVLPFSVSFPFASPLLTLESCVTGGCSGHGTCDESTGFCACEDGFAWFDCSVGCSTHYDVTDMNFTITDGSAPDRTYFAPVPNCSWTIHPQDNFTDLQFMFNYLDTSPQEPLTIYDGPNNTSPILAAYSGTFQTTDPITFNASKVLFLEWRPLNLGYRGFNVNFTAVNNVPRRFLSSEND